MARVTRMTKRRLGELLCAEGLISEEQVQRALDEQRAQNLFFGEALVRLGFITEEKTAEVIARQFSLPHLCARQYRPAEEALDVFPEKTLRDYQFLPLDILDDRLVIVGAGLMSRDVLDELERRAGMKICQYIGMWSDIREAISRIYKERQAKAPPAQTVSKKPVVEKQKSEKKTTAASGSVSTAISNTPTTKKVVVEPSKKTAAASLPLEAEETKEEALTGIGEMLLGNDAKNSTAPAVPAAPAASLPRPPAESKPPSGVRPTAFSSSPAATPGSGTRPSAFRTGDAAPAATEEAGRRGSSARLSAFRPSSVLRNLAKKKPAKPVEDKKDDGKARDRSA